MRMTTERWLGFGRHLLTGVGSILAANGVVSAEDVETGIGVLLTIASFAMSFIAKREKKAA